MTQNLGSKNAKESGKVPDISDTVFSHETSTRTIGINTDNAKTCHQEVQTTVYKRSTETQTDEYDEHNFFRVTQKSRDMEALVQAVFDVAVDKATVVQVPEEVEEEGEDGNHGEEHDENHE